MVTAWFIFLSFMGIVGWTAWQIIAQPRDPPNYFPTKEELGYDDYYKWREGLKEEREAQKKQDEEKIKALSRKPRKRKSHSRII